MQRLPRIPGWHISETRGDPITAFDKQITPIGRVIQVNWRGGTFIHHRPAAIEMRQGDTVQRLPIQNATSRAIATTIAVGVAIVIAASWSMRRLSSQRRRKS